MPSLTGRSLRTLTGYVVTLLEYPRWSIEREVDFTDCHLAGHYQSDDSHCVDCHFGEACRWLNSSRGNLPGDATLDDLVHALGAAVGHLRASTREQGCHPRDCECETCSWLREAGSFLRVHRHHS